MKNYYYNHNQKALDIISKNSNKLFSYLNGDPKKVKFNHIITVPVSQRNENNGFPNFRIQVNEKCGHISKYNVRVETNTFQNYLTIETSKVLKIQKCNILIFEDKYSFYISETDHFGNRDWLTDKRYFRQETVQWSSNTEKTYNKYNLRNLVKEGKIVEVSLDEIDNKIVVIDSLDYLLPETEEIKDTRVWKDYYNFNISTSHITQVQYDGKQPKTMYWCTKAERYTKNIGSSTKIALFLSNISTLDTKSIYQRLTRVYNKTLKDGKAYCTKIPANQSIIGNLNYDQSMLDDKGNIVVYVSNDASFDVIDNKVENVTDDLKSYQKVYQKVYKWIKKNPNNTNFPNKWSEEDIECAKKILSK